MTAQCAVLILDLLQRAEVPTWVAGGWGVDALVGWESRPHADLDLLIPEQTSSRARQSLAAAGFVGTLDELPTRFEMTHQRLGVVDLHPIRFDANGEAAGGAPVIHTDDFAAADNPIDWWPRLLEQVIEPFARGDAARYQRYDWPSGALAEWHTIEPAPIVIIEGVSAGRSEWAGTGE